MNPEEIGPEVRKCLADLHDETFSFYSELRNLMLRKSSGETTALKQMAIAAAFALALECQRGLLLHVMGVPEGAIDDLLRLARDGSREASVLAAITMAMKPEKTT